MRIRKNIKKLSSLGLLLLPNASPSENNLGSSHFVCQLNQSPWDVIPFSSCSSFSSSDPHQLGRDDNGFAASLNGCDFVDSVGPIESDEKLIVGFADEVPRKIVETDGESLRPAVKIECAKTDGKFWIGKREAKEGHHFCEHHILQLKFYGRGGGGNCENIPGKANGAGPGWVRATRKKKSGSSSSSGSNQYYNYSGFGPQWGEKQGESRPGRDSAEVQGASDGISYLHFEDGLGDGDEEDRATMGKGSKKRVRKPIKARSLKSVM